MSGEKEKKGDRRLLYVVAGVIIAIVALGLFFALNIPALLNPPKPEIISTYGYDGFQGLNYVIFVDVTVKNNGGEGWITVYAEISGAGKYEKQQQRIYLSSGETQALHFVFDVSFWGVLFSQVTYRAWAVPG